jgi:hypothetical protein
LHPHQARAPGRCNDHALGWRQSGGLAFLDRHTRAANVRADSDVVRRTLPHALIDTRAESDPVLHAKLLRNLLGVVIATLHGVNTEIAHLTR